MKKILIGVLITALLCALSYHFGRKGHKEPISEPLRDTTIIYSTDTIKVEKPVYYTKRIVDTITIIVRDTILVKLPREERTYKKDSVYYAVVSGFNPSLDTIEVYPKTITQIVTVETTREVKKNSNWGIGVQAGYGFSKDGFSPYVGVGVSYNIFSW